VTDQSVILPEQYCDDSAMRAVQLENVIWRDLPCCQVTSTALRTEFDLIVIHRNFSFRICCRFQTSYSNP